MHVTLKTLLNHVEPWKGFVYESSRLDNPGHTHATLTISLRARRGSQGRCGQCEQPAPVRSATTA